MGSFFVLCEKREPIQTFSCSIFFTLQTTRFCEVLFFLPAGTLCYETRSRRVTWFCSDDGGGSCSGEEREREVVSRELRNPVSEAEDLAPCEEEE